MLTTGIEDTCKLSNEESKPNANRGEECTLVFFGRQHEDGEDEFGGQEHLDD
jgi:hypothetical protein